MPTPRKRNDRTLGVSLPHDIADLVQAVATERRQSMSAYFRSLAAADIAASHKGEYRLAVRTGTDQKQYWTLPTGDADERQIRVDRESFENYLAGRFIAFMPHSRWVSDPDADFQERLPPEVGDDPTGYWRWADPTDTRED